MPLVVRGFEWPLAKTLQGQKSEGEEESNSGLLQPTQTGKVGGGKGRTWVEKTHGDLEDTREDPTPHQLPVNRDTFVGRNEELEQLEQFLDSGVRLLTILGMGGTGKTRLALRYAHEHLRQWNHGVYFCDLTDVRDEEGICRSVASALGMPLQGENMVDALGRVLAAKGEISSFSIILSRLWNMRPQPLAGGFRPARNRSFL